MPSSRSWSWSVSAVDSLTEGLRPGSYRTVGQTLELTIQVNAHAFLRSIRKAGRQLREFQAVMAPHWRAQHEVMVSGLEARYYTRGAFTEDAVEVCRDIRLNAWAMDLTRAETIRLQVAAIAGAARAWT